jgi:anaerobic magnesium-protoporphyrin IX monomethyl ester cyclase
MENISEKEDITIDNVRDAKIVESMARFSAEAIPKKSVEYSEPTVTKKTSLVLMMLPQWSVTYAPYNLARLSGITGNAGYKTTVFDVNVNSYIDSRSWIEKIHFDPWNSSYMTKWFKPEYQQYIHELIKPTLERYIEKTVELNPTVVGFTLYDSNRETLQYVNRELRKRLPNLISMVGGPICNKGDPRLIPTEWEYVVSGEGEKLILDVLDDIEHNGKPEQTKKIVQPIGERSSLDELPLPNWNFYNFNDYVVPNGATLEFSRGCIAKCVFCDETHFWKFRGRSSNRVLEEITDLHNRGVNNIWFVDSLLNGNLKELRNFSHKIVEHELKIRWIGYARCDGRMDLNYFKDLVAAGCYGFSYGVESGSDKVLADMHKGITAEEVFNNFRDGHEAGMESGVMLIVGFPTEKYIDFYKTLELVWRIRNFNVSFFGCGFTLQLIPETVMGQDGSSYGILDGHYGINWITKNFENSKLHRLVRLKCIHVLMEHLSNKYNRKYNMRPNIVHHHTIKFENPDISNDVEPEDFDFNIINLNTDNNLANTIINEVWPLLRMLYRGRGAYEIVLNFEENMDIKEFQPQLTAPFNAVFKFKINASGEWEADFKATYKQPENYWQYMGASDYGDSAALERVKTLLENRNRKLAAYNPDYKPIEKETYESFMDKYEKLDLSFDIAYKNTGKW